MAICPGCGTKSSPPIPVAAANPSHYSCATISYIVSPDPAGAAALQQGNPMQVDLSGKTYLVTGGSGFFGDCFIAEVLERGARVINIDIVPTERRHPALTNLQIDIRDAGQLDMAFSAHVPVSAVFHFAALLAHGEITVKDMYGVNVDGT